jgi:hypothetical protein
VNAVLKGFKNNKNINNNSKTNNKNTTTPTYRECCFKGIRDQILDKASVFRTVSANGVMMVL